MGPLAQRGILLEPSSFLDAKAMAIVHTGGSWRGKLGAVAKGAARRLHDALTARRYDLVLVHRESSPLGPAWFERTLSTIGIPYAFDFDDAVYLPAASAANNRFAWLKAPGKTAGVVAHASMVIAGNEHLADWARASNPRVCVIPTTIDTDAYCPDVEQSDQDICIGWSGSLSTLPHLRILEPILRDLQHELGVRIRVIGDADYRLAGAEVESLPWREKTELEDLRRIDIGVMPLPDDEWAKGKCGLKALQYMALAIPTVLSPVGVNSRIARDGAAILASSPDDWRRALTRLVRDREFRAQVGRTGRLRVEQEYSVSAITPAWEDALRSAARTA